METFNVKTEELCCAVCLDIYHRPKSLNCGHSFCSNCITNASGGKAIVTCPLCRQVTKIPEEGLPINFVLSRLTEQLGRRRDDVVVLDNQMSKEMTQFAVRTVQAAENDIDNKTVSDIAGAIKSNFSAKYGGFWHCIIKGKGKDRFCFQISGQTNNFIALKIKEDRIYIFKSGQDKPCWKCDSLTCNGALCKFLPPHVISSDFPQAIELEAQSKAMEFLRLRNTAFEVARDMQMYFDGRYGQFWHCVVLNGNSGSYFDYRNGYSLAMHISNVYIFLFRTNNSVPNVI